MIPDIEAFEERAAIAEYDGGLSRESALRMSLLRDRAFQQGRTTGLGWLSMCSLRGYHHDHISVRAKARAGGLFVFSVVQQIASK